MEIPGAHQNLFPLLSVKEEPLFQDCKIEDSDLKIKIDEPVFNSNILYLLRADAAKRIAFNKTSSVSGLEINPFLSFHHDDNKVTFSNQEINYNKNSNSHIWEMKEDFSLLNFVKNECPPPKPIPTPIDMKCIQPSWMNTENILYNFIEESNEQCSSSDIVEIDFLNPIKHTQKVNQESYEENLQFANEERESLYISEEYERVLNPSHENHSQLRINDNIAHSCSNCNFTCTKVEILVNHFLRHHKSESNYFICPVCRFKTLTVSEFKRHMCDHTGEQLFNCPCCEYVSSDPGYYELHMENHPGEKGFACLKCSYRARYFRDLQCHIAAHTREKDIRCPECEFKCSFKKELKNHMLMHTFDKPFSCSQCPYKCKIKWLLKTHMLIHTGEIQFACSQCDFRCNRKSSLLRHMLIHKREKPFACSDCDYKCMQKEYMKRHMVIHTGEEPYSCTFCDYKCRYNYNLKKHLLVHGIRR